MLLEIGASKTNNIFLIGLQYSADIKWYGNNQIIMPIFTQLQQLKSDSR